MRYKFFFALVFAFLILVPSQTVFAGNSTTVTRGDPMPDISWSVGGAPGCATTSSYPGLPDGIYSQWVGFAPGTGSGSFSFSGNVYAPGGSYDFTCTAGAVSDTATLNVNDCPGGTNWNGTSCAIIAVPAPSISFFDASPNNHGAGGGSSTLSWSVSNATSCWASGGWSGSKAASGGSEVVFVGSTSNYFLECWNSVGVGSGVASVTVTVAGALPPPSISFFDATPNNHGAGGGSSTLDWSVSNATFCWGLDGWSGFKNASGGSETVFVGSTTTYILECSNGMVSSGQASVTVTVAGALPPPVISSFTASPNNHPVGGGSSTVTWTVSNATSCDAAGGDPAWNAYSPSHLGGSSIRAVGVTATYQLQCWNSVGVSSGIRTVTVTVVGAVPAALHICPPSATVDALGPVLDLVAWYTPTGTSFISCANPTGAINRTANTTWTSSNPARASVGVNTGVVSGLVAGVVTITANDLANGVNSTAPITVTGACTPDVCGNHATEAANICTGDTFPLVRGCSLPDTSCPGTRLCDYNWKEVAP